MLYILFIILCLCAIILIALGFYLTYLITMSGIDFWKRYPDTKSRIENTLLTILFNIAFSFIYIGGGLFLVFLINDFIIKGK